VPSEAFIHLSKNKIKINLSYVQKKKKNHLIVQYEVGKKKRGRKENITSLFFSPKTSAVISF
jgi:hypothetical protein